LHYPQRWQNILIQSGKDSDLEYSLLYVDPTINSIPRIYANMNGSDQLCHSQRLGFRLVSALLSGGRPISTTFFRGEKAVSILSSLSQVTSTAIPHTTCRRLPVG